MATTYSKINFSEEGVRTLLKMASDLKDRYDDYARAGNELIGSYEELHAELGVDAEPVYDLIERLNDELTQNCQELLDLGVYCETLAKEMEVKLGTKIAPKTNFI